MCRLIKEDIEITPPKFILSVRKRTMSNSEIDDRTLGAASASPSYGTGHKKFQYLVESHIEPKAKINK